jgi:hypothetical protein
MEEEMRNTGGGGSKESASGSGTARRAAGKEMKCVGDLCEWQR